MPKCTVIKDDHSKISMQYKKGQCNMIFAI